MSDSYISVVRFFQFYLETYLLGCHVSCLSKLLNWSLDYWLTDRLVPRLTKLTNRSPNFTNVTQIGPFVKSSLANSLTWKTKKTPTVHLVPHQN